MFQTDFQLVGWMVMDAKVVFMDYLHQWEVVLLTSASGTQVFEQHKKIQMFAHACLKSLKNVVLFMIKTSNFIIVLKIFGRSSSVQPSWSWPSQVWYSLHHSSQECFSTQGNSHLCEMTSHKYDPYFRYVILLKSVFQLKVTNISVKWRHIIMTHIFVTSFFSRVFLHSR